MGLPCPSLSFYAFLSSLSLVKLSTPKVSHDCRPFNISSSAKQTMSKDLILALWRQRYFVFRYVGYGSSPQAGRTFNKTISVPIWTILYSKENLATKPHYEQTG